MTLRVPILFGLFPVILGDGCASSDDRTVSIAFRDGEHGWRSGFADYPEGADEAFELTAGLAPVPAPVGGQGFRSSGNNHSDSLFMFLAGRVEDLLPTTRYRVSMEVEFASNAGSGCVGVGGSPGESVFFKAGASAIEPKAVVVETANGRNWQMNVDKGAQSQSGGDALVLGDIAVTTSCTTPTYVKKVLTSPAPQSAETATDGSLWLMVGTDSGFEATTTLYYLGVTATLELE